MTSNYTTEHDCFEPLRASRPPMSVEEFRSAHRAIPQKRLWNYGSVTAMGAATLLAGIGIYVMQFQTSTLPGPISAIVLPSPINHESMVAGARTIDINKRPGKNRIPEFRSTDKVIAHLAIQNKVQDTNPNQALQIVRKEKTDAPDMPLGNTSPVHRPHTSEPLRMQAKNEYYASLQAGAIMGSLSTPGGGFALTATNDWMQATFRYTSTFGTSTSELFYKPIGKSGSQNVNEYALMFGARLEQGNFWASLEAGPNIIHAFFQAALGSDTTVNSIGGSFGASAQATFGYKFNDNFGLSLTGFASNHSITYGGILLSIIGGEF